MNAELCRLLSAAIGSPYQRYAGGEITPIDTKLDEYLIDLGNKAKTVDQLPERIQAFLRLCERSVQIHWEIFQGNPSGMTTTEEDAKVIERMTSLKLLEAK